MCKNFGLYKVWATSLLLLPLLNLQLLQVHAAGQCFVYGNPSDYPKWKRDQCKLRGHDRWDWLRERDWEGQGVFDWEKETPHMKLDRNECGDRFSVQSPIVLEEKKLNDCVDDHRMRGKSIHEYDFDKMDFETTDHSLRATFSDPKNDAAIDFSNMPTWFRLSHLEVKVPSEHTVRVGSRGDKHRRYDGELVFQHYGELTRNQGDFRQRMLHLAVFLEAGHGDHEVYEEYLQRWEERQRRQYKRCDFDSPKRYKNMCKLKREVDRAGRRRRRLRLGAGINPRNETSLAGDPVDADGTSRESLEVHRRLGTHKMYKRLVPGRYYWKYNGSTTNPPCAARVVWRIMQETLKISDDQLERTENLIAAHLDGDCRLATVCAPRDDGKCGVRCNRPLQRRAWKHDLRKCDRFV